MGSESNQTTSEDLRLYQAIKDNNMEEIKLLLDDGRNLNEPIVTSGPFAGYTALHVACMGENYELSDLLIEEYKVDVNITAEDGTQPIHLACLYEQLDGGFLSSSRRLRNLLDADANANAEVDREMFSKHVKDREWFPDFGDKMSLCTYTVISDQEHLTDQFAFGGAHIRINSLKNKTLLMYIIERVQWSCIDTILYECRNSEYLNHRDNDGIPATHYLFHPEKYGNYRYDALQQFGLMSKHRDSMMSLLLGFGADKYALINDDPATFIPNMAAYRSCAKTLYRILPHYTSMSLSKALYYATLPIDENSEDCIRLHPEVNSTKNELLRDLQEQRRQTIQLVLKDLINRITFGLSVSESEEKLMEKLMATDLDVKKFVHSYKKYFINGRLKNKVTDLGDKKVTLYDFIMDVFNDKRIKLISKDKTMYVNFKSVDFDDPHDDYYWFRFTVRTRMIYAINRSKLLKKLKKISSLTEAIPLPYELILDIVEYLSNSEFDIFIQAFISL